MRRWIFLTFAIASIIPLLGSSNFKTDGITLRDFPKHSLLYESLSTESMEWSNQLFILPEGVFDQKEAADIILRISILPPAILEKAVKANIKIKLFEGSLTDNASARHLKGVVPRGYHSNKTWDDVPGIGGSKLVLVKIGSSTKGNGHSSENLEFHEFAHSLDRYVFNGIRSDPTFLKIWKKESRILFPGRDYFINYPEEFFAECFAMYYVGGVPSVLLKEAAPQTYQYIKQIK